MPPSITIAADTMILMSAATGGAVARVFREPTISIVTTDYNMVEAKEHVTVLIDRYHLDPDDVADALAALPLRLYRWGEYESQRFPRMSASATACTGGESMRT